MIFKEIYIKGLFGEFRHKLNFDEADQITYQESHLREGEILERYGSSILNLPEEVSDYIQKINVRFLSFERLLSDEALGNNKKNKRCYKVEHIAVDLKNKLTSAQKIVLKNLEDIGDKLERDILQDGFNSFDNVSKEEFETLYEEYQDERNRLESASLSAESKSVEIQNKIPEDNERKLIAHIIKQRKGAYEPYSDMLFNIELFHEIVNSALTKKHVKININKGLEASSDGSGIFPVNHLSSGEQQVIILAHTLLFSMEKNSIALIDEPELSMDVEWQSKLSTWLDKIGEKRNLTFILATHSPLLLMGREDSIKTLNA